MLTIISPIVPAFLWCALLPPSLQALLMLLLVVERLPSSPPDSDSKFDCMNLSLRPTWSTLSMLRIDTLVSCCILFLVCQFPKFSHLFLGMIVN